MAIAHASKPIGPFLSGRRSILPYVALVFVMVCEIAFLARHSVDIRHGESVDVPYFSTVTASNVIDKVSPAFVAAGLHSGDTVVAVDGHSYTGTAVTADELAKVLPGTAITLTVRSNETGAEHSLVLTVQPDSGGIWNRILDSLLQGFLPLACLFLGSWVVFIRPRDRASWLLLGLLLGFSHLLDTGTVPSWGPHIREWGMAYNLFWGMAWPIFMFLFAFFFPEPFPRYVNAGKWRALLPLAAVSPQVINMAIRISVSLREISNYAAANVIYQACKPLTLVLRFYPYILVSCFFAFIFMKSSIAISDDGRRRLMLLYWGTTVAVTPGLIFGIVATLQKKAEFDYPQWLIAFVLLMLLFFPLTLAYVIVVQRAMEVRVVLRQGLQYGLAKSGIRILQYLVVFALVLMILKLVRGRTLESPQTIALMLVGAIIILTVRRAGDRLRAWTDQRFFREAYNAEQVLSELSDQVRSMIETRPLIETVALTIADTLHVTHVAVFLRELGSYRSAYAAGYGGPLTVAFAPGTGTVRLLQKQHEPARVYFDDPNSWVYRDEGVNEQDRAQLNQLGSELLLPLTAREKLLGFISLGPKRSEEPYSGSDVRLLKSVAAQTGLALENAHLMSAMADEVALRERLNREVEIAREVQERLFPQKFPPIEGIEYAGACRPALGVGGDYYDFLALPNGQLGIAIGDVSGKGIAAALMMASLQASLRGEATRAPDNLAAMISNVNRLIFEASADNRYATFFYAQYDPASWRLTYVNAGHNPPMLFHRCGDTWNVSRLEATGTVVGLLESFPYEQRSIPVEPGDIFVAFTDGISEAMNQQEEEWGESCLERAVEQCEGLSPSATIKYLMQAADEFVAGAKQHDDMTLVVLRAKSSSLARRLIESNVDRI